MQRIMAICAVTSLLGAAVTVIYDASAGCLAFCVNGGPELPALSGFPSGAGMRPFVSLQRRGDRVRVSYVSYE